MNLNDFVNINQLKQADAIILRKKVLGMVDHYAIFLGYRNNYPLFVANYRDGVQEVSEKDMIEVLAKYNPEEIERFNGSEFERQEAVKRGFSRLGERAYNYITNNCEHFKNWVHFGENRSEQVKEAGNLLAGTGVLLGIGAFASKNPKLVAWAAGLLLLGGILSTISQDQGD